jgi:hypothetical protein
VKFTAQQHAVIDAVVSGGDCVANAGAGTGKTTVLAASATARGVRGQYLAFNNPIVRDAGGKFPRYVPCNTVHSLGWRAIGSRYGHRVNADRLPGKAVAEILGCRPLQIQSTLGTRYLSARRVAALVGRAIRQFEKSVGDQPTVRHVSTIPFLGATVEEDEQITREQIRPHLATYLQLYWQDMIDVNGRLPFVHDTYLKLWSLSPRCRIFGDVIYFDEAQDTDPVMMEIVERQAAQKIWVGDRNQAIYEWRGAINALDLIDETVPRLGLTQSFRFGPAVAEAANWALSRFCSDRISGDDRIESICVELRSPAAMLFRTNARMMAELVARTTAGERVGLVGEAGKDALSFVEQVQKLQIGLPVEHRDLVAFGSWEEVLDYVRHDCGGDDLRLWVELIMQFGCDALIGGLKRAVAEEDGNIILCTAHRAKGREWVSVRLADDFVDRHGVEEYRLLYVAITRARLGLDLGPVGDLIHQIKGPS